MTVRRIKRNNLGLHDKAPVGHIADLGQSMRGLTREDVAAINF